MENIQVAVRLRPLNYKEISRFEQNPWSVNEISKSIQFDINKYESISKNNKYQNFSNRTRFYFSHAFGENINNKIIYEKLVQNTINSSLEGINGTIFTYGQTGSGKTYTILGGEKIQNSNTDGILICAMKDMFEKIRNILDKEFIIKCSYLEIYNDQVYDLLLNDQKLSENLQIVQNHSKEFIIPDLTELKINSFEEVVQKMLQGEINRHYASTVMNHKSSRSHTIFRLSIKSLQTIKNEKQIISNSILNFVDLAGSEKLLNEHDQNSPRKKTPTHISNTNDILKIITPLKTHNSGNKFNSLSKSKQVSKETQHINKSLFFLTSVISLISQGIKEKHIPFRNSPLTKILRSSLGGNSKTSIILCLNPCLSEIEQSLGTLRFGINAKKIQNLIEPNFYEKNVEKEIVAKNNKFDYIEENYSKSVNEIEELLKDYKTIKEENFLIKKQLLKKNEKILKIKKKIRKINKEKEKFYKIVQSFNPKSKEFLQIIKNRALVSQFKKNIEFIKDQLTLREFQKDLMSFPTDISLNLKENIENQRNLIKDAINKKIDDIINLKNNEGILFIDELGNFHDKKEENSFFNKENNENIKNKLFFEDENLLSNVSNLWEEKFEIENLSFE